MTGLVDISLSFVEVPDFSFEVFNIFGELSEEAQEITDCSIRDFQVVSLVDEVILDLSNKSLESGSLGNEFFVQRRSSVSNILDSLFNQLDHFVNLATGSQVEFDCGNDLLGNLGFLSNEAHSLHCD